MVNRVKANSITITVDGDDFTADLSSIMLQSEEASTDVTTFADAAIGGSSDWFVELSGVTSTDTTSFWMTCWNNPGAEVPFVLGVTSPTAGEFDGILRIAAKGRLPFGGEASADGSWSFSGVRFEVVGEPDWTPDGA
jgi:hypothetical protein